MALGLCSLPLSLVVDAARSGDPSMLPVFSGGCSGRACWEPDAKSWDSSMNGEVSNSRQMGQFIFLSFSDDEAACSRPFLKTHKDIADLVFVTLQHRGCNIYISQTARKDSVIL